MKKSIVFLLTCLIAITCTVTAFASENTPVSTSPTNHEELDNEDTTPADQESLERIELAKGEYIIQVYGTRAFSSIFSEFDSIENVLIEDNIYANYHLVINQSTVVRVYREKEMFEPVPIDKIAITREESFEELMHNTALHMVSEQIQIQNMYLFTMQRGMGDEGSLIYYETDLGVYIYYQDSSGAEYLFTPKEFKSAMQYLRWMYAEVLTGMGGSSLSEVSDDYSRYDIHSPDFYLNSQDFFLNPTVPAIVWIVVAILPITAAVGIGLYVKKRKAQRTAQMQEDTSA